MHVCLLSLQLEQVFVRERVEERLREKEGK